MNSKERKMHSQGEEAERDKELNYCKYVTKLQALLTQQCRMMTIDTKCGEKN